MSMLGKTFKDKYNLVEWLKTRDDIVEMLLFSFAKGVVLKIVLIVKVEELDSSTKLNSTL